MENRTINYDSFVELIRHMFNVSDSDFQAFYFFLHACEFQDLDICQACLDAGLDINIKDSHLKDTLLTTLIRNNTLTLKIADWLIANGIDINCSDDFETHTPLNLACYYGQYNWVEYLLSKGAKITNNQPNDTIYYAVKRAGNTDDNCYKIIKLLLEHGASLNYPKFYEDYTALCYAVKYNFTKTVKLLLEFGASPDIINNGITPLHIATANGNLEIARILLEYKANSNISLGYDYFQTPMDMAVINKDDKMIKLLSSFGGIVSERFKKV